MVCVCVCVRSLVLKKKKTCVGARVSVVCRNKRKCNVLVFKTTYIFIQYVYDFHCLRLQSLVAKKTV